MKTRTYRNTWVVVPQIHQLIPIRKAKVKPTQCKFPFAAAKRMAQGSFAF